MRKRRRIRQNQTIRISDLAYSDPNTLEWLLDSDPALRWQVMRDLTDAAPEEIATERARVAVEGWGAHILALQDPGGTWDGGTYRPGWVDETKPFFDAWTATHYSLMLLADFGLDPESQVAVSALTRVRDHVRWRFNDAPYFSGEAEPCVNGIALRVGSNFGQSVDGIVDQLMADRLGDGGWNCDIDDGATVSSFHSTICVLEGLLAWEKAGGSSDEVTDSRREGEEYLLQRKLFRRRTTGDVVDPRFTMFSFPNYWYYDLLRAVDYFRSSGTAPDGRLEEALDMVRSKRDPDGRWRLENRHQGPTHIKMEREGDPSRWVTLRALRVLNWADAADQRIDSRS